MQRRQVLSIFATFAGGALLPRPAFAKGFAADLDDDAIAAEWFECERRFRRVGHAEVAYMDQGDGPAALFIHGFPLSNFQWRGAIARLMDARRCIAPDLMGLGQTRVAPGADVTPAAQVEMLRGLLDAIGIDTVDLVANDSGGAVAQLFVVRYPGRVRTMLLTNCDVEFDSPPPALLPVIDMAREGTYPDKWLVPWVNDKALARSAEGLGGLCYSDPRQPTDAAIDMYLKPLVASPERKALTNAYTLGLTPNPLAGIEARLRRCQVPTRIVWGMSDTIFSARSPGYLDRLLPKSKGVRAVPKGKLFFPEEYPDLIAEEARRLWRVG